GAPRRGARRRGDPAHVDRRGRDSRGLRPRAYVLGRGRGLVARHRLRWRRQRGACRGRALRRAGGAARLDPAREPSATLLPPRRGPRPGFANTQRSGALVLKAAIVQDALTDRVLMLGWMNEEAERLTRETGNVWFWSRSREQLWRKGETSGNTLAVRELRDDCGGEALL